MKSICWDSFYSEFEGEFDEEQSLGIELFDSEEKISIKPEKRRIGLVFQDTRLFPHLNVLQNLEYAAKRCKNSTLDINNIIGFSSSIINVLYTFF